MTQYEKEYKSILGNFFFWDRYLTYNRFKHIQYIVFKQYDLSKASNLGIVVIFEAIHFHEHYNNEFLVQTEFKIKHTMKISFTFLPSQFIGFSSCLSCCKAKLYEMK